MGTFNIQLQNYYYASFEHFLFCFFFLLTGVLPCCIILVSARVEAQPISGVACKSVQFWVSPNILFEMFKRDKGIQGRCTSIHTCAARHTDSVAMAGCYITRT